MRFHLPTRIIFQSGVLSRAGSVLEQEIGTGRTFLVTDKGVQAAGITDNLLAQFPDVTVFDE
ncbi:MAG: hypothetical protein GQ544_09240, partial [Candidatus Aminicenantes bacterium]|nr:hypothetical protein [Candidatus Aminicenantes bacterium]